MRGGIGILQSDLYRAENSEAEDSAAATEVREAMKVYLITSEYDDIFT